MLISFQMTIFSDYLTSKLAEDDIKPADLAKRMGKDQSIISRFLSGERSPQPETIVELARGLNVPPEEVFRAVVGLPPKPIKTERIERVVHILNDLDPGDIEEIIKIAKIKRERGTEIEQTSRRVTPARTALKEN
jgi:transcriptional regulator with XRE-family HTH domain